MKWIDAGCLQLDTQRSFLVDHQMVGFTFKRRYVWRIVVAFVVAACATLAGGVLYVAYIARVFGECKVVVLNSMPSPDGKKSIIVSRKECAATVPYSVQASISSAGSSLSSEKDPVFFIVSGTSKSRSTKLLSPMSRL